MSEIEKKWYVLRAVSGKESKVKEYYLCGDQDGIGEEVLRRYADGLQGHYARYAQEILNSK